MLVAGPVCRSDQFGNTPFLLSTKSREPIRAKADHVSVLSGRWQPRDTFYLATDALAQWLLAEHEADRPPWPTLGSLGGDGESSGFERLVEEQRVGGSLHNDDTTLLSLEVD